MDGIGGVDLTGPLQGGLLGQGPLRPGQILQGVVESANEGLLLRIGTVLLSIEKDAAATLAAGQQVSVQVVQTDQGLRLRLLPQAPPAPPAASEPAAAALFPALASVLEALGSVEAASRAAVLLPPNLPQSRAAVRLALSLFLTQASTGEDLQTLSRLVAEAADRGALPAEEAESFAALVEEWLPLDAAWLGTKEGAGATDLEGVVRRILAAAPQPGASAGDPGEAPTLAGAIARLLEAEPQLLERAAVASPAEPAAAVRALLTAQPEFAGRPGDAEALAAIIRQVAEELTTGPARVVQAAAERAGRPVEARLAAALASGRLETVLAELEQDVRTRLGRLGESGPFVEFLRQSGRQAAFEQAAQRVLDRCSGAQLQNLRGLDVPYHFLEIPFAAQAPIRRAQIHIFGEGGGRRGQAEPQNAAVAIDLTTTRLGELWISLAIRQGACRCWIRARTPEVVRAIEERAPDLAGRLCALGYATARVGASLWGGDRVSEAVSLLAQFREVNLQA